MADDAAYKLTRKAAKLARKARAAIQGNGVSVFWWSGVKNFGDLISPYLFERYGVTPIYASAKEAQVVSTGSILHMTPEDFSGLILGSGLVSDKHQVRFPKARIAGLRGPFTREAIGAPAITLLGDPGLLMSKWTKRLASPRYALGLIPHFHDKGDPRVAAIKAAAPHDVKIIDVQQDAPAVAREIAECAAILSSSLHGIILADALGVAAGRLILSGKVEGGDFKFNDHDAALGLSRTPLTPSGQEPMSDLIAATRLAPADRVAELQAGLDSSFRDLRNLV